MVPINRSVGLKAKPTKPVAEVLRPVVAKYGLRLNDLVARIVSHFAMATCICGRTSVEKQGWSSLVSDYIKVLVWNQHCHIKHHKWCQIEGRTNLISTMI